MRTVAKSWRFTVLQRSMNWWPSYVTYEWLHAVKSVFTHEWFMSHINVHIRYESVMSHMNQIWRICMSHVTYAGVRSPMNGCALWKVWAHGIHSARISVMTNLHVTWLIYMWRHSHVCIQHESAQWLIHMWHDSFICDTTHSYVTWLIHMWHDSFVCEVHYLNLTWLIHMWHDSFICDMTHLYVMCVICVMTHSYVTWLIHIWHDSFICDVTHLYVTWFIHMCYDSLIYVMHHLYVT